MGIIFIAIGASQLYGADVSQNATQPAANARIDANATNPSSARQAIGANATVPAGKEEKRGLPFNILPDSEEEGGEEAEKENDSKPDAAPASVNQAWEVMWAGQKELVREIRETALKLSQNFSSQTASLAEQLRPFEEEGRRLLVFTNTFAGHPNPMEAVARRIGATIENMDEVLEPMILARKEAQTLLSRVNQMVASLPYEADKSSLSPEMQEYVDDLTKARFRLMAVLAQYNSLLPSLSLVDTLEKTRKEIKAQLSGLWERYYLDQPVTWLNPEIWTHLFQDMYYSWQTMILRLPVELPVSRAQWGTAMIRFLIGVIFAGIFSLLLRKRFLNSESSIPMRHIFRVSVPWLVTGFAMLASSISSNGQFFRVFLAIGSLSVILGQTYLAWDLRLLQYPEEEHAHAPFLRLMPLVFWAYILLYLPLTQTIALLLWTAALIFCLAHPGKHKPLSSGQAQLEKGILDSVSMVIWLCLLLSLTGFYMYSIGLWLAFAAISIALELTFGGMALVSRINEHLPKEGAQAVIARLIVALAAPFVLVVAVAGACLWIAVLPGGTYLIGDYAFKGVSVGATQFNVVQLLLIVSGFYLTRTVVSMGTRFLSKLPSQGVHFDATLITPLQTALTYAAWAIFGLFVLRALGMELSNLAMIAGGLSVGIGFGMQTIVNNFISGLILIFGRTLQVGDVVEVGGVTGRVRKISVRATMVETYDNAIIYVPNSEFMSNRLINWTSFTRSVRKQVQVGVAYGSDTALVIRLLIDIASAHENVLKFPAPSVNFADFAASSLDFRLRFWVKDYELGTRTCSDIRLTIDRVFAENKIDIAFPQLDVHLKNDDSADKGAAAQDESVADAANSGARQPGGEEGGNGGSSTSGAQKKIRTAANMRSQAERNAG